VTAIHCTDHRVDTSDRVGLRVRSYAPESGARRVLVLVHGISAPLVPTFDLPIPGYSFMGELAGRGYNTVALDHRNFGGSDRDPAMFLPPAEDPAGVGIHGLDDSLEDIRAVIADAKARYGVERVVLFGSSRGALQVLAYAALHPGDLSLAILNNPSILCYRAGATQGAALDVMRRELGGTRRGFNYLLYTEEVLRRRWRKLFGQEGSRVEPEVQEAYIRACLETDPDALRGDPPGFRVPTEAIPLRTPLVAIEQLSVPCLVVEGEEIAREHLDYFLESAPAGLARVLHIRDTDHFTLRNARRFELANIIDAAVMSLGWGERGS
jgi:alpha-beta hydrolase superfamily lysophospholipase